MSCRTRYRIVNVDLSKTFHTFNVPGTFIDVLEAPHDVDLRDVLVRLDGYDAIPASLLPIADAYFSRVEIENRAVAPDKVLKLLIAENMSFAEHRRIRFGRDVTARWVIGDAVSDPYLDTELVSYTPVKPTYVYGFFITAQSGNTFSLEWGSYGTTRQILVDTPTRGTVYYASLISLNESYPATSKISIKILNSGFGLHQAGLLVGEY